MEIINGVEQGGALIVDPTITYDTVAKTDNYTVKLTESGKTLTMTNNAANKTFTLPSVASSNVGVEYTFANLGSFRLTIDAADSDTIGDSTAGGTVYTDDDNDSAIKIRLVSTTHWAILGADGTWVTT